MSTAQEAMSARLTAVERRITTLTAAIDELTEILLALDDEPRSGLDQIGELAERTGDLQRRVDALQADQFSISERVRQATHKADRAVSGLDDMEEVLGELDLRSGDTAANFEAAMRQREDILTAQSPSSSTSVPSSQQPPDTADGNGNSGDEDGDERELPTLEVLHPWVNEHIAPLVRRVTATGEGGGVRWCQRWWLHHDAVERFTALYLAYKELSEDDTLSWLSIFLRDHLDAHLSVLTSPFGPLYACSPHRHSNTAVPLGQAALNEEDSHGSPDPASPADGEEPSAADNTTGG